MPQKKINKEEKKAPGFKTGRDRVTLLFCINASIFLIMIAHYYKAVNSQALKSKDKHGVPVFWLYSTKA